MYADYLADPFVLETADGYVAYCTRAAGQSAPDGREFAILTSADLVSWQPAGGALEPVAAELGSDYWAPEVVERDGTFYMYFSIGYGDRAHHLRVATSPSALGPFVDAGVNLSPGESFAIDPNPFLDSDGTWYLYYARDVLTGARVGTSLAVDVLDDMTRLRGEPASVLLPSSDWQLYQRQRRIYDRTLDWHTLEGPCVVHRAGRYYLLYSGGSWKEPTYAVSWAVADHPLGPWTAAAGRHAWVLRTVPNRVIGPGHNSVITAPSGTDVIVYHAWDPQQQSRRLCIDPLVWTSEGPRSPGPTWTDSRL